MNQKMKICVISYYNERVAQIPISNLIYILRTFSDPIYIINRENITSWIDSRKKTSITIALSYIHRQLDCSWKVLRVARDVDVYIFYMGGITSFLPMLIAKLLRKKVVLSTTTSYVKVSIYIKYPSVIILMVRILEKVCCILSDIIILHSSNLIKEWNLEKYRHKISIAHEYFLDFDKFKVKGKFDEKANLIGYVGRLSKEKGTLNFVKAIPQIIKEKDGLQFLIGGDGSLRDEIEKYINEEKLTDKVKLTGWISHDQLPDYLNKLKLLVIPSYTESGPIIALEAMACGTPILATRTGHVLEMIEDGKTGFIMENNSSECIARNVIKVLNHPNLEQITKNARALVEREFTYEKAVEGYRSILASLSS